MTQTQAKLTEGEKILLKELNSINDRENLITEQILSLERVLWQLLAELGKVEKGARRFDSQISVQHHEQPEHRHKQ